MSTRKLTVPFGALVVVLTISLMLAAEHPWRPNPQRQQQHVAWVTHSLRQMLTVKTGMTRADLLKVFTAEGGLSTVLHRTYVYRNCPYFKVDVDFDAVGRPSLDADGRVTLAESDADVITKISAPYLAWSVTD